MQGLSSISASTLKGPQGRLVFWIAFFGLILAGWALLFWWTASPLPGVSAAEYWAALCVSADSADPVALFAMWALMTAAMMLPTFVPALRVFGELGSVHATDGLSLVGLAGGYALLWLVFAAFAAVLQYGLAWIIPQSSIGQALVTWHVPALLLATGAYQFSPAKAACLAKCRHPLLFFMEHWSPGPTAAFAMGVRLGAWCVGCCWLLMALGFIGGAMNLIWMGGATLLMTLEKLPDIGRFLTKPLGLLLVIAAIVQVAGQT